MSPIEQALRVDHWTHEVMLAIAREAIGDRPREEIPQWLAPRIATVLKASGGQPDDVNRVLDEILGLGPLEPLLRDKENREIRIRGPHDVQVVRDGATGPAPVAFADVAHLERVFGRIFRAVKLDPAAGRQQTTMMDGSTLVAERIDGALHATIVRPG